MDLKNSRTFQGEESGAPSEQEESLGFLRELREYLIAHWETFGFPNSPKGLAYRLRQTPQEKTSPRNRQVALWFTENPEELQVVTKWVSDKRFFPLVYREYSNTRALYKERNLRCIPKPLDCIEILGIPVLIQEAARGRSFAHQLMSLPFELKTGGKTERLVDSLLRKAGKILGEIQGPLVAVSKQEFFGEFDPILQHAGKMASWSSQESEPIQKTVYEKAPDPIPGTGKTFRIGNFTPANILDGSNGTFLLDLEHLRESTMALLDPLTLLYYLSDYFFQRDGKKKSWEILYMLQQQLASRENWLGNLFSDFLIQQQLSEAYFPWYWLIFLIHRISFQARLGEAVPQASHELLQKQIELLKIAP